MSYSEKIKNSLWLFLILFFGAGSFLVWFNAIVPKQSVANSFADETLTYVDAQAGFSVEYPKTWTINYESQHELSFQKGETGLFILFDTPDNIVLHQARAAYLNRTFELPPLSDEQRKNFISSTLPFAGGEIIRKTWGDPKQPYNIFYQAGQEIVRNQLAFLIIVQPTLGQKLTESQVQTMDAIVKSVTLLPIQAKHTEPTQ